MWHMADMGFSKKMFVYYEIFYIKNCGWNFEGVVVVNSELKRQVVELQQCSESKDKEIENKDKEI